MTFDTLLNRLTANPPLRLIALAGPPASGKTSLAAKLAQAMGPGAQALPMDGFHLDNDRLRALDLLHRKGAPETFDARGFLSAVDALSHGRLKTWPGFDRDADAVVPDAISLRLTARTFVIEGNYLLLKQPIWQDLRRYWDRAVWLDIEEAVLHRRLVQRWLDQGLSEEAAKTRAEGNDLVNARLIIAQSDRENAITYTPA
jgi:pantothenate kinase